VDASLASDRPGLVSAAKKALEIGLASGYDYVQILPDDIQFMWHDPDILDKLSDRAQQQGTPIEMLDQQQLRERQAEARPATGIAIYVPRTAVDDPLAVMRVLGKRPQQEGIHTSLRQQNTQRPNG